MNDFSNIIDGVFLELGFEIVKLDEIKLYRYKENYYKMTYISDFRAYVIEFANNFKDAQNNVFEDGDTYLVDLDVDQFIKKLRADLIKYYC